MYKYWETKNIEIYITVTNLGRTHMQTRGKTDELYKSRLSIKQLLKVGIRWGWWISGEMMAEVSVKKIRLWLDKMAGESWERESRCGAGADCWKAGSAAQQFGGVWLLEQSSSTESWGLLRVLSEGERKGQEMRQQRDWTETHRIIPHSTKCKE